MLSYRTEIFYCIGSLMRSHNNMIKQILLGQTTNWKYKNGLLYIEWSILARVFLNALLQTSVEYLLWSGRVLGQALLHIKPNQA